MFLRAGSVGARTCANGLWRSRNKCFSILMGIAMHCTVFYKRGLLMCHMSHDLLALPCSIRSIGCEATNTLIGTCHDIRSTSFGFVLVS